MTDQQFIFLATLCHSVMKSAGGYNQSSVPHLPVMPAAVLLFQQRVATGGAPTRRHLFMACSTYSMGLKNLLPLQSSNLPTTVIKATI
jgi:hypothetical protein